MKKRFSADQLYELRNTIAINTVIQELLSIPAKTSEGVFRFLCPVCNEFYTATNPATNLARCFVCQKNFNPIDLVMAVQKSSFVEAVTYLQGVLNNRQRLSQMLSDIGNGGNRR